LSLEYPSCKVEYRLGETWIDLSADVLDFNIWLRDIAAGMSEFEVLLDNTEGKHSKSAGTFPAFGIEQGLYYMLRIAINNSYQIVGRMTKPEPILQDKKDTFKIHGYCLGQELNNLLIQDAWYEEKADDIIEDALTKAGATDVTFSSPSTAPVTSIETMQNPRYLIDIIREICELTNYAAFVKTQAAVTQGTLLFFPKADTGKRHSTVLKSILYDSSDNVMGFDMPRSLDEIKNWALLIGRMSHAEPPSGDGWTEEGTKGWTAKNAVTSLTLSGKYAPIIGGEGQNLSHYSILGSSDSKIGPWFRLSIPTVLGEPFNCTSRNGDFLHFWYAVKPGVEGPSIQAVSPKIILEDADGNRIFRLLDLIAAMDADWWSTWIWFRTCGGWREHSAPIGWSAGITDFYEGSEKTRMRDWAFEKGYHAFNWDEITFIEFQDYENHPISQKNFLWIDGLYFHQAYTPTYIAKNQTSIGKYGLRMERPSTVDFVTSKDLKTYGDNMMLAMSQPTLLLRVDALIDPAAEALYPAYSIPVNIPRIYVTSGSPYFRILDIHYHWFREGLQTTFELIPSTVS